MAALPARNQTDSSSACVGGDGIAAGSGPGGCGAWVCATGRVAGADSIGRRWGADLLRVAGGGIALAGFARSGGVVVAGARFGGEVGGAVAQGGRGEKAGVPEEEDLFEAGEDAGEDGGDEGVQGGGLHSPVRPQGR